MGRKRGKTSQKSSNKSTKPVASVQVLQDAASVPETPTAASATSYITRKIRTPAILTNSLLSHPNLMEGITILYPKTVDILTMLQEAYPLISLNGIDRLWRSMHIFPCVSMIKNVVFSLSESTHCNLTCNGLCILNDESQRFSAFRLHSPSSNMPENWIMFIADDTLPEYITMFSEFNKSKHFLSFEDGVLRWAGSLGNLDVIRGHITETTSYIVLDNLCVLEEKVELLCAGNGMGKTALLNRLENQAKKNQPDLMVLTISLSNHTQLLNKGLASGPINFLQEAAGLVTPSELSSFESALHEERVTVLFDCLDEISPLYLETCCELFTDLRKTFVKLILVVVGRETKKYVEDKLCTLAADLCEFSQEEQKLALTNSWKSGISKEIDENLLELITNKLIEAVSLGFSDIEKEFVGIALQNQMVEDIFLCLVCGYGDLSDIPEKLGMLDLFDRFCKLKCNNESLKSHQLAALYVILGEENHSKLLNNENAEIFQEFLLSIESGQEKSGIVNGICDGKPRFSHPIFADYLAAKWLASCESGMENCCDLLFKLKLKKTLFIFNRVLAKDCHLHTSILNDKLEHVKKLMESKVDVNARDLGGRTALHMAATLGDTKDPKAIATRNEILDLLLCSETNFEQEDNILGVSPLEYAIITRSWSAIEKLLPYFSATTQAGMSPALMQDQQMLEYIVENDLGLLMAFCFKCGFVLNNTQDVCKELLPTSSKLGSTRVASVLIQNGANIWITYGQGESPLHLATCFGHLDIVRLLVNANIAAQNSLRITFSRKLRFSGKLPSAGVYINLPNKYKETALQLAISFAQLDIVQYLLKEKAAMAQTNLQVQQAVGNAKCDAQIVKAVLNEIHEDKRIHCVNGILYHDGSNAVHAASTAGNVEMVRCLLEAGGSPTKRKYNGRTPLMVAAWWGHLDLVKFLLDRVPQYKKMKHINIIDEDDQTALKLTTHYGHADVVKFLLEQNADKGDLCELINFAGANMKGDSRVIELILSAIPIKDRARCINTPADLSDAGYTAVNSAAKAGNLEGVKMLIQAGGNVTIPNDFGRTPLMEAASLGHLDMVRLLAESSVKQGMSKRGYINRSDGALTALHHAILGGHLNVINYLVKERADMVNGVGALMIAVANIKGDVKVVDAIYDYLPTAMKKLCLNKSDRGGNTVVHLAAKAGNLDMVVRFVEKGGKMSTSNNLQDTPLTISAAKGHKRIVKYLLDTFDEEKEGMKKMNYINKCNRDGLSAANLADKNGHIGVLVFINKTLYNLLGDVLGN